MTISTALKTTIKNQIAVTINTFLAFKHSDVVFIVLLNVKMAFNIYEPDKSCMSMINAMLT